MQWDNLISFDKTVIREIFNRFMAIRPNWVGFMPKCEYWPNIKAEKIAGISLQISSSRNC